MAAGVATRVGATGRTMRRSLGARSRMVEVIDGAEREPAIRNALLSNECKIKGYAAANEEEGITLTHDFSLGASKQRVILLIEGRIRGSFSGSP
jgi:hypothetical protein